MELQIVSLVATKSFCSSQSDTKNPLLEEEQRFTNLSMSLTRALITFWIFVVALSFGLNGIATAAGGVAHEIHCADRPDVAHDHSADHGHELYHSEYLATSDVEHDHETCMFHACPALFPDADKNEAAPHQLLTRLHFVDPTLQKLERVESLHRPPNT
ncbi:MAG: hypothetical protein P1U83_18695 [Roseovarius sp.]|nr:hypothetical protein [Roseovarius sp.]